MKSYPILVACMMTLSTLARPEDVVTIGPPQPMAATSRVRFTTRGTDYTLPLTNAVRLAEEQVQHLQSVGGFAGFTIEPTEFLLLSAVLIEGGDREMFKRFAASTNPVVQAMGAVCLSQTSASAFAGVSKELRTSNEILTVWTSSCLPVEMTLGQLVDELQKDRNFLGHDDDYWEFQEYRKTIRAGSVPMLAHEKQ